VDADRARPLDEVEVVLVVEEELRDQEARARIDLALRVLEVLVRPSCFRMDLRKARRSDAELGEPFPDQLDQVDRPVEAFGMRDPLVLPARWIAPQRED